jgi:hypothetical protein
MDTTQKPEFSKILTKAMGAYGKPLPETAILKVWWELLEPFPLQIVALAIDSYMEQEPKFAPIPNAIAQICKKCDGRPGAEEAWAASLAAQDEMETVVWTTEMSEAFWLCKPLLDKRDEVGARMAFKEAYNRLVAEARRMSKPAKWQVSPGKNQERHRIVYEQAVQLGRLPAPEPTSGLLLQGPAKDNEIDHEGLERVKALCATLVPASEKAAQRREAERQAEQQRKKEIDQQVRQYMGGNQKKTVVKRQRMGAAA